MKAFILVSALIVMGDMPPKDEKADVDLPISCNPSVCVVPIDVMKALAEAHNLHVGEIERLKKQLESAGCKPLPPLKRQRDA